MLGRFLARTALLLCVLAMSGCIELLGQRIAWFHDEGKDELRFLLCYDGIHDDPDRNVTVLGRGSEKKEKKGEAERALSDFVMNGDVMLLDWWGVLAHDRMVKEAANEQNSAKQRRLFELVSQFEVSVIGTYRDPEQRIGAAQRVVIPRVSGVVAALNAVLAETILDKEAPPRDAPKTHAKLRAAAESGHAFVKLEGQAIVFEVPVDDGEYLQAKDRVLRETLADLGKELLPKGDDAAEAIWIAGNMIRALGSAHLGYEDGDGFVRVRIGSRSRPSVVRISLANEYVENVGAEVERNVPARLPSQLAGALIDSGSADDPALADFLAFGPREEVVRALALAARDQDPARAALAFSRLQAYVAHAEFESGGYAPLRVGTEPSAALSLVDDWYRKQFDSTRLGW